MGNDGAWKTLESWNELLEKFKREEVTRDDLALFVMGMDVMGRATYQAAVAADNEWRLLLLDYHERQTAALEAIAQALVTAKRGPGRPRKDAQP